MDRDAGGFFVFENAGRFGLLAGCWSVWMPVTFLEPQDARMRVRSPSTSCLGEQTAQTKERTTSTHGIGSRLHWNRELHATLSRVPTLRIKQMGFVVSGLSQGLGPRGETESIRRIEELRATSA